MTNAHYLLLYNLDNTKVPLAVAPVTDDTPDRVYFDPNGIDLTQYHGIERTTQGGETLTYVDKAKIHVLVTELDKLIPLETDYLHSQLAVADCYRKAAAYIGYPGKLFRRATADWKTERQAVVAKWLQSLRDAGHQVGGTA